MRTDLLFVLEICVKFVNFIKNIAVNFLNKLMHELLDAPFMIQL